MAIYTLAPMEDRPLGSLEGATFQKCGVQFGIRKRNVPVQKRSARQSAVKNKFDHVQKNWKNLTSGNQTQWQDEAPNYTRTNSLGNPYNISGSNLQASSNINLLNAAESELAEPANASAIGTPTFGSYATNATLTIFRIFFDTQIVPAGYAYKIYMSTPQRIEGAQQLRAQQKLIQVFNPGANSHANFATAVRDNFPNAIDTSFSHYFWLSAELVQLATGQQGTPATSFLNY